ncbi:unnamed protein product, partial [Durusdinium trenchii]
LQLLRNSKYMQGQTLYVMTLLVRDTQNAAGLRMRRVVNPQTTSAVPEDWHVQSYSD